MKHRADNAILPQVASYYDSKLKLHGSTSHGVDWNGNESHDRRHRQFLRLLETTPDPSIIDLGCGFGDFFRFLRLEGYRGSFTGYDISTGMIEKARQLFGESGDCRWRVGSEPEETADFAIASGIFNVRGDIPIDIWTDYVQQTIDVLARAGSRGFAFNILSLSSDEERRRPNLYYADPAAMLSYCVGKFGRSVALLQDYELYEFTLIVRHPAPLL